MITNVDYVSSWNSKVLSAESIKSPTTSDNSLTPALRYYEGKTRVKFVGSYLKQPKISYTHGKVGNIYIVYKLDVSSSQNNDHTLKNCLFRAVALTENAVLISMGILVMELNMIEDHVFHFQAVDLV